MPDRQCWRIPGIPPLPDPVSEVEQPEGNRHPQTIPDRQFQPLPGGPDALDSPLPR